MTKYYICSPRLKTVNVENKKEAAAKLKNIKPSMASRSNSNSNFSESSYDYDDKEQPSAPTSDRDDPLIPGLRNNSFNGLLGFTVGSKKMKKKKPFYQERAILGLALFVVAFVGANWWMLSRIQNSGRASPVEFRFLKDNSSTLSIRVCLNHYLCQFLTAQ